MASTAVAASSESVLTGQLARIGIELPSDWGVAELGSLFEIQQGKSLSQKARTGKNPHPFLRTSNILWGRVDLTTVDEMDFTEDEARRLSLQSGDLLVCEGGEVGRAALWQGEMEKVSYQNHLHRLRRKNEDVVPEFFMYWMQAGLLQLGLYAGTANRTTIPNLSKSRLSRFPVPVPPANEQRSIAHVLRKIQQAKEATEKVIAATRELKRSLMRHLFTYGPTPINQAEKFSLQETEIGLLPRHWQIVRFSDVLLSGTQNGIYKSRSSYGSGVPIVDMVDIFRSDVLGTPVDRLSLTPAEIDKYGLRKGDLLFARRSFKPSGSGKCQLVEDLDEPTVFSSSIIRTSPDPSKVDSNYLRYFFTSSVGREVIGQIIRHLAVSGISGGDLKGIPVPLPPLPEQHLIAAQLASVDNKLLAEEGRQFPLTLLFQALLRDLMTGRRQVHAEVA